MITVDHNWQRFDEPWRTLGPQMAKQVRMAGTASGINYTPPWWRRLSDLRKATGLSVAEVGRATGHNLVRHNLWSAERGEDRLPRAVVEDLALFYCVPFDEIAGAVAHK